MSTLQPRDEMEKKTEPQMSMKDWILQYADQDEDEDGEATDSEASQSIDPVSVTYTHT